MEEVVARLGTWLAANHREALDALAPGLTDDEIAPFEKELGVALPAGLRALLRWHNGNQPGQFTTMLGNWQLMSLADIVRVRAMMNKQVDDGAFKTANWWRKTWIPFASNKAGDHLCWDPRGSFSGSRGQVLEFWHTDHDRKVLAPTFEGWLEAYVDSLEAGLWTHDPEVGFDDHDQFGSFLAQRFAGYPHRAIDRNGKRPQKPAPPPAPVEADPSRPVQVYDASIKFSAGDQITHPQFGLGVVQSAEMTKIEVRFSSGIRVLLHAKAGQQLTRPRPFDHTRAPTKV